MAAFASRGSEAARQGSATLSPPGAHIGCTAPLAPLSKGDPSWRKTQDFLYPLLGFRLKPRSFDLRKSEDIEREQNAVQNEYGG